MSKSLKNVINPDDVIKEYGADSVRMYEMFMGPLEISKPWNTKGLVGVSRFLEKVWAMGEKPLTDAEPDAAMRSLLHKTIKKVTEDTANLCFNTAISQMMIFVNDASKLKEMPKSLWTDFVKMISVYAPHLGEELWEKLGNDKTIAYEPWPTYNEAYCKDDTCTIVIQVNGKIRDKIEVPMNTDKAEVEKLALETEGVKRYTEGQNIVKVIVVPNKIVNIVAK
jgi:leucyl-tRNA synthetase